MTAPGRSQAGRSKKALRIDNVTWMCLRQSGAALLEKIGLNAAKRAWLYGTHLDAIAGGRREVIDHDRVREVNELVESIATGRQPVRIVGAKTLAATPASEQVPSAAVSEAPGVIPVLRTQGKSRNERLLKFVDLNDCSVQDVWRSANVDPKNGKE